MNKKFVKYLSQRKFSFCVTQQTIVTETVARDRRNK